MAQIGTDIKYAISLLDQGKTIGMPTDTVYGVACNALNHKAIEEIYTIKHREKSKALLIQTFNLNEAFPFLEAIPLAANRLADEFWPGALTLVFKTNDKIPKILIAGGDTVGIRVPNHSMALKLLKTTGYPLAVTSANVSGMPSPITAEEVNEQIGDKIDYILDGGKCAHGIESTIVGFNDEKPIILRHGAISENEIGKVL